jgi:hypothetical protein
MLPLCADYTIAFNATPIEATANQAMESVKTRRRVVSLRQSFTLRWRVRSCALGKSRELDTVQYSNWRASGGSQSAEQIRRGSDASRGQLQLGISAIACTNSRRIPTLTFVMSPPPLPVAGSKPREATNPARNKSGEQCARRRECRRYVSNRRHRARERGGAQARAPPRRRVRKASR